MKSKIKFCILAFFLSNNLLISSEIISDENLLKHGLIALIDEQREQNKRLEELEKKYNALINGTSKETSLGEKEFIVKSWGLSFRKEPSTQAEITRGLSVGNIITIEKEFDDRWFITKNGDYVAKKYVQAIEHKKVIAKKGAVVRAKPYLSNEFFIEEIKEEKVFETFGLIGSFYVTKNGNFIYENSVK